MKHFDREELADKLGKTLGSLLILGAMYFYGHTGSEKIHVSEKRAEESVIISDSTRSVVDERKYILTRDDFYKMDKYRIPHRIE